MPTPRPIRALSWLLLAGFVCAIARFAAGADLANEEPAVRAAGQAYLAAKRSGDYAALGKLWTPEGDYVDSAGRRFKAQELCRQQAAAGPAEQTTVAGPVGSSLRFVTPGVAIEDGVSGYVASADGELVAERFTALWVKRDSRWLLDSLREYTGSLPTLGDQLAPLAWLLGEWAASADGVDVIVSTRPSDDGNYLVREFLVRETDRAPLTAVQRIGWDPQAGKIKSWQFDSTGGLAEGYWRREGNGWVVEGQQVTAGGQRAPTTSVYTPTGEDRFTWELAANPAGAAPARKLDFKRARDGQ
jgi:uncharacterized protein (TIGR02246 family)